MKCSKSGCCSKCNCKCNLTLLMESYFQRHGDFVARHPCLVIVLSLLVVIILSLGFFNFHWETNAIKLWIPKDSDFVIQYNRLWSKTPPEIRPHSIIFATTEEGDNILQSKYLKQMMEVRQKMFNVQVLNGTFEDFCFQVPVSDISQAELIKFGKKRRKRAADKNEEFFDDEDFFDDDGFSDDVAVFDPTVEYYPEPYCGIVESMPNECLERTILELFAEGGQLNDTALDNLTTEDIIHRINTDNYSGLFMREAEFMDLLGGVVKDEDGKVVSARAVVHRFWGKMNGTKAVLEGVALKSAVGEYADSDTLAFEAAVIEVLNDKSDYIEGLDSYAHIARSFNDIASANIMTDVGKVVVGFAIVFTYVVFMLGDMDMVENRMWLSLCGLSSIYLAMLAAFGVCYTLGFPHSPLNNFIPFLLMGLGIDDMFVIVQSWHNFAAPMGKGATLASRFGATMRHAGVAITVTSVTDVVAFAVGSTTLLPALRSFCIFCALGIFFVYLLQATYFLAWMTLDQRRIEARRNGMLPCIKHHHQTSPSSVPSNQRGCRNFLQRIFRRYSKALLLSPPWSAWLKAFVVVLTLSLASVSAVGFYLLRQEFNPLWFLPKDSYLSHWADANDEFFPTNGHRIHVFMSNLSLPRDLPKIEWMENEIRAQNDIVSVMDSWYTEFKRYHERYFEESDGMAVVDMDEETYRRRMTQFLYSPAGSKYRFMFTYAPGNEPECGSDIPDIPVMLIQFRHKLFSSPSEQIGAMNRVKNIVRGANFTEDGADVFPFSKGYAAWETDEVIMKELYRNLLLATACVTATTLPLLSSVSACAIVIACVVLTLLNVAGFMHFWGLTIDTVSCTNLIICVGVCVDYSAHVAHAFIQAKGSSRASRAAEAVTNIGPAVLNGGFSTFLSFILLADSNSHVFTTFFRIFFLVVLFALYNGLVLLPVILSWVGPMRHHPQDANDENNEDRDSDNENQDSEDKTGSNNIKHSKEPDDDNEMVEMRPLRSSEDDVEDNDDFEKKAC